MELLDQLGSEYERFRDFTPGASKDPDPEELRDVIETFAENLESATTYEVEEQQVSDGIELWELSELNRDQQVAAERAAVILSELYFPAHTPLQITDATFQQAWRMALVTPINDLDSFEALAVYYSYLAELSVFTSDPQRIVDALGLHRRY